MTEVLLSVVVCTFNRVKLLDILLKSLIKQDADKKLFEIIVVDNNSSDNTKELADKYIYGNPKFPIKYIRENKIGLSNARNRGVKESRGDFVAFLDDDSYVKEDWVGKILSTLKKVDKKTVCVGGPILSYYQSVKPDWFKDEYASDLSKGTKQRYLGKGESFSGSNMVWRKEILIKYSGFRDDVGMKGDLMSVGEETGLFERVWGESKEKNIFLYFPDIIVYHLVPIEKMTVNYRLKRWFVTGQSVYMRLMKTYPVGLIFYTMKLSGYFILSLLLSIILIVKYRKVENWAVERIGPFFYIAGYLSVLLGFNIRIKNE